ncbi:hypothetical protein F511_31982 [Dorcoceras hygrometricum]|uniref:Uncharacterized protein n=1 Tax=Dorcoceras hygrometricum TaxID=472368 RepID=A0A2Z7AKY3_9LAMI|nr:hypothetical protein F511_31982 [Dorcoceras hygrometricum]
MMNSRRICPADGSQYKDSAVGLVFMESAAGLAMETSKVESVSLFKKLRRIARLELERRRSAGSYCLSAVEKRCARYRISCDDISSDVITISSWLSADEEKQKMKRRRAEASADGLALMTSSVTSSYSADGLKERSQESAGSLFIQTQRFALALKIQQEDFALITSRKIQSRATVDPVANLIAIIYPVDMLFASSRKDPDAGKEDVAKHCNQAQSIQSTKISAEDEFSRCDKSAAKQLTIYESWMSTAERNSNGESDKTQSTLKMERING